MSKTSLDTPESVRETERSGAVPVKMYHYRPRLCFRVAGVSEKVLARLCHGRTDERMSRCRRSGLMSICSSYLQSQIARLVVLRASSGVDSLVDLCLTS